MATYSRKAQAGKGMRRKGTSGYSTFGFIGGGLIGSRIDRGTLGLCRRPPNRLCPRHIRVPGFGVLDDGLRGRVEEAEAFVAAVKEAAGLR